VRLTKGHSACADHWLLFSSIGSVQAVKGRPNMDAIWHDLRHGMRMLLRRPGFTVTAVLTLAIGIGSSTVVYSWSQAVLFHPLGAVAHPEELAVAETVMPDGDYNTSSYPDYLDYRARNHVFTDMIGVELVPSELRAGAEAQGERTYGQIVTGNFFDVLGVEPERGRTFTPEEDSVPGGHPVTVISDGLWRRRFGSDPNVIGKVIDLDSHPFTVIGVAPPQFGGVIVGLAVDFWVPMMTQPQVLPGESLQERSPTFVHILGRLKPGVSVAQAQADLGVIASQLAQTYPDSSKGIGIWVGPLRSAHYGAQGFLAPVLGFLMAVVLMVLLIGCVNIANLLLARATFRERELAIRTALGASRARLMRQLLAESLVLAVMGGAAALLAASWGVALLSVFLPPVGLPIGLAPLIGPRVFGFALLLTLAAAMLFGLVPAIEATRRQLPSALKEGGRGSSLPGARHRMRMLLVVSEVALAVVLMIGAGLLVRSFRNVTGADPGFDAANVRLYSFDLRGNGYSPEQAPEVFDRMLEKIRALPGVQSASSERYLPLWFVGKGWSDISVEDYVPARNEFMGVGYNVVAPEYFATMKIPLISGREFSERDRADAPRVAIVNETTAKHFWAGRDPLNRRFHFLGKNWTVVGIARDSKYHSLQEEPLPFVYVPHLQQGGAEANVLVRATVAPAVMLAAVRAQVNAVDPRVPVLEAADVGRIVYVSLFANRIGATLASGLGVLALLLASLGIYGVLSSAVSQRVKEIGIRVAMGAQRGHVLQLIVRQGMLPVLAGTGIGLALGLAVSRLLANQLYGVRPRDPFTFVGVAVVLSVVALAACWIPAHRATKVDPMVALRYE
jgi:predicted permease